MLSEDTTHRFLRAVYPVGLMLVLVPLFDLAVRTYPPQFGTLQWRFATGGLLLGNYGTVALGIGLCGVVAALTGDRRVLRAVGAVSLLLAVLTLALLVLFALDALQIRRLANPALKGTILRSSAGALFTGGFGVLVWLVLGRAALVASRTAARAVGRGRAAASPLVAAAAAPAAPAAASPAANPVTAARPTPAREAV